MRDKDRIWEASELRRRAGEDELKRMLGRKSHRTSGGSQTFVSWKSREESVSGKDWSYYTRESSSKVKAKNYLLNSLSRSSIDLVVAAPFCGGNGGVFH